ncbi:MAG TPA: efflux RND transporter periplasmic adaptor subunit [Gemmatimonadales bacterium]|nr:efflux RND transporter periplasmic adaptor subunit [Gemmatimonadales bacterium]
MQAQDLDPRPRPASLRQSVVLVGTVLLVAAGLTSWKFSSLRAAEAAGANPMEPAEVVTTASAVERAHSATTTAIGTVRALRSVTLRNEVPGTVRIARLTPGQIVEPGTVLVALDVSVEEASLRALEAQAELAGTVLERTKSLAEEGAASREELDRARAERDVAVAEIARLEAVIARKTIRAPFRARVGISDVHTGQYLSEGTELTTLQGVADPVHIDFDVAQVVAGALRVGQSVDVFAGDSAPLTATIVAVDARVDPETRNALVRARLANHDRVPAPGASVRVRIPTGPAEKHVFVPVSALRKGPGGDQVFVLTEDSMGTTRAAVRRVVAGDVVNDEVLVADGIEAGEQVATSGSFKLRDGAKVQVKTQDAVAAANAGAE